MITAGQIPEVTDSTVYGVGHEKIGKVGAVFVDEESGTPQFATVRTGMLGRQETFVPLDEAQLGHGELNVPYEAQQIKEAPNISTEQGRMSEQEEDELYRYYGLHIPAQRGTEQRATEQPGAEQPGAEQPGAEQYGMEQGEPQGPAGAAGAGAGAGAGAAAGAAGAGTATGAESERGRHERTQDDVTAAGSAEAGTGAAETRQAGADEAMTRSEEQLRVGTEQRESGRARLHKYVETEEERRTVPVRRERARVEHEPITEENREQAMSGPGFTESEEEVVLHEERPVVETEEVPVERVRLTKETETEHEEVSAEVRKERIEEELPGEEGER